MTRFAAMALVLVACLSLTALADRPRQPPANETEALERKLSELGLPTDTPSVLAAARSHEDSMAEVFAIRLLSERGGSMEESQLRQVLDGDEGRRLREEAALGLVRMGHEDVLPILEEFLVTSEHSSRRLYLIGQLAQLGICRGYADVVLAATSEDEQQRRQSTRVLVYLLAAGFEPEAGEADPVALLLSSLRDPSDKVRVAALVELNLGAWKGLDVEPFLEEIGHMAEKDPDPDVRRKAQLYLAVLLAGEEEAQ